MKRQMALVLALVSIGLAVPAIVNAQATTGSRAASLFDLGFYGGGAYSTDWFESRTVSSTGGVVTDQGEGEGHRIGFAPVVGANATFYGLPWFGVRVHYGYMPSDLPEAGDGGTTGGGDQSNYFVNNHFYDLSLLFRLPGLPVFSSLVSNVYGWVGGGGLTTNVSGEGPGCVPELLAQGACLSVDPDHATVGQGVVGLGGDLVSLAANVGLFAEVAAHIYDSPVHVGGAFVPRITVRPGQPFQVADDYYAVTPRVVAGLKFAFGDRTPVVATPPLPPPPPPAAPMAPPPPPPPPPATRDLSVCVVTGTGLQTVTATFNPANNDTTAMGQRFSTRYPASAPTYAAGATWFVNTDAIRLNNSEFVKFGVPRMITSTTQLQRVGEFQGTSVFAETGASAPYQVLYVPLRPGCEFQPYSPRPRVRG